MGHIAIVHIPDHTTDSIVAQAHTLEQIYGARLVGIFNYPVRRELADHPNCKPGWTRDRMGFMKCGACGKRNKQVRQFLINALFDFLGANLYPKAPGAFRTPEGYGDSPQ